MSVFVIHHAHNIMTPFLPQRWHRKKSDMVHTISSGVYTKPHQEPPQGVLLSYESTEPWLPCKCGPPQLLEITAGSNNLQCRIPVAFIVAHEAAFTCHSRICISELSRKKKQPDDGFGPGQLNADMQIGGERMHPRFIQLIRSHLVEYYNVDKNKR